MAVMSKWDIVASVILSRAPIVAPQMQEVERRFQTLQLEEEAEKSLLNDYELKSKNDQKMLERRAALEREGKELSELDEQIGLTNAVREDEWARAAQRFENQYKFSQIPQISDLRSVERQMDRKLVLIVKQTFGQKGYKSPWILPQIQHRSGETLRQTAERCIGEVSKNDLNFTIAGNAPIAVHSQKYPAPIQKKTAQNTSDFAVSHEHVADFQWVTPDEFRSTVNDKRYKAAVSCALSE
ncbi:unnamed protein product [Caenorhabditis auriculariae]|uniref:39S ribosomal protein L46, mitochondrial n=1 Tax=Caenorhabditis auriculariae TaxID=2777116 RepID=A0A8S1HBE9_9PELO|nr:unnamed protein product [Caenorhabditis auriculariae]